MQSQEDFDPDNRVISGREGTLHLAHQVVGAGDQGAQDGGEYERTPGPGQRVARFAPRFGGEMLCGGDERELPGERASHERDRRKNVEEAHEDIEGGHVHPHDEALAKLGAMIHEILPVGMLACNCSVIGDEVSREAIVIDPGDDISEILAILKRHELTVKTIVITHAHIDHIGGAANLRALTGAPVYMHEDDTVLAENLEMQAGWLGVATPENPGIDKAAKEGDVLRAGAIAAQVLHTPGHTPGSLSLFIPVEKKLIAGDTLFRGSVGRTDLPGGDSRLIKSSIQDKLYRLPEDTVVTPGHGEETTIGREKKLNAFVRG